MKYLFLFLLLLNEAAAQELPVVELHAGKTVISAEVAATPDEREQGLMQRRFLQENHGMIFVFPEPTLFSMWMKDTLLPLSVAFLDAAGAIINIEEMLPLTDTLHPARHEAKYALEMNSNWFSRHGIREGDRIDGVSSAEAKKNPPGGG